MKKWDIEEADRNMIREVLMDIAHTKDPIGAIENILFECWFAWHEEDRAIKEEEQ